MRSWLVVSIFRMKAVPVAVQFFFLDWVTERTDIMKTWLTSLIPLFLWQLPVSLSEEGRWEGVRGAGVVGSLVCEPTYCLNCCHTRLVCNKGQVRHSGRNLFCPTAFFFSIKQKSLFWQPDACSSGAVRAFALRRCTHSVLCLLCVYLWRFFFFVLFCFRRGEAARRHRPRRPEESTHPPVRRGDVLPGLHHRRGGSDTHTAVHPQHSHDVVVLMKWNPHPLCSPQRHHLPPVRPPQPKPCTPNTCRLTHCHHEHTSPCAPLPPATVFSLLICSSAQSPESL